MFKVFIVGPSANSRTANGFTTLDADLFKHSPRMQYILIAFNSIQTAGVDLLVDLTDLIYADLRGNICIDIWAGTPQEIQNLKLQLIRNVHQSRRSRNHNPPMTFLQQKNYQLQTVSTTTDKSEQCRGSMKIVLMASLLFFVLPSKL